MSATDKYLQAKREHGHSIYWRDLIGSPYGGGGGGVGRVVNVFFASIEIYHQEYNGANNYHEMPKSLKPYLEESAKHLMGTIITKAISLQERELARLADLAQSELKIALKDAGVPVDELGEKQA